MESYTIVCVGLFAFGLIAGCSPMRLVNATVSGSSYVVDKDVPYGELPRQRLDVYRPREAASPGAPAPIVVFFYGGSWQGGSKDVYPFVAEALASKGFLTVIPDYRVYPEVMFPAFVQDAAAVVRWAHDNAAALGADPRRIYLMGHSAGAHIAVLLTLDPRYLRAVGLDRSDVRATVGLAGPYDFLPFHSRTIRALFGPSDGWPDTQPINFVDGREPPLLLLSGAWDTTVSPGNTRRLIARVCQRGGNARATIYPGIGHGLILGALSRPLRPILPVFGDVTRFLQEH
jgi:acetyl esterase/lipase